MYDYKIIIGVVGVILTFAGYIPYITDMVKKKTSPHAFTWLVWTLAVGISAALQIKGGAGAGAWTTVTVAVLCLFIFLYTLKNGVKNVAPSDILFLVLALVSLGLWVVAEKPVLSAILIVSTDILGFIPTIRKSWNNPYSETLFMYQITTVRHALSIVALRQLNTLTLLYPVAWTVANLLFSVMLMVRRKVITKSVVLK